MKVSGRWDKREETVTDGSKRAQRLGPAADRAERESMKAFVRPYAGVI